MSAYLSQKSLGITTKIGCSVNCTYCPQGLFINQYKLCNAPQDMLLSFDNYKICIDKLPNTCDIHFAAMCEPWLNPQCTDMVLYAHEKGHKIVASTTLVGVTENDFNLIRNIPFKAFGLHIPDSLGYTKINITDEYLRLLKLFCEAKNPGGGALVTSYSCHSEDVHPAIADIVPKWVKGIQLIDFAGNVDSSELKAASSKTTKRDIVCIEDRLKQNILLPNGLVTLCCMDFGIKHILGNLLTQSWDELHQSPEYIKIQNGMKDDEADILCRNCTNARNVTELYQDYAAEKSKHLEALGMVSEAYAKTDEAIVSLREEYENSSSWRVTASLRAIKKFVKR